MIVGVSVSHRPIELRKRRETWAYWTATPSDLAEVAELAHDLVARDGRTSITTMKATAPAFEATFLVPEQIRGGLDEGDLKALSELVLEAQEDGDDPARRRIAVTAAPPPRQSSGNQWPWGGTKESAHPAVALTVSAADADWVDLASLRMKERIDRGARARSRVERVLLAGFFTCGSGFVIALAGFGDKKDGLDGGEIAAIVFGALAGMILLLFLAIGSITPALELLPDGAVTRWATIKRRTRVSGSWVFDAAFKGAIGAALALLIDRLA
jgi:hypothetical protein